MPDAELEWQKLRREIRGGAGSTATAKRTPFTWFALPIATAAALAVTLFVHQSASDTDGAQATGQMVAKANGKAAGEKTSTVVFVDDKSGWTFVVATDDKSG